MSKEKIGKGELTAFPTLYKKSSTGATVEWNISVEGDTIVKRWGQTGGAIQETRDVIKTGKNTGRANATTAEEQAVAEAQAQWTKKLKKDYNQDIDKAGETSELIEGGILPMLAHKYRDKAAKIEWPAFAQPKLDGHRCLAMVDGKGKCELWSRSRKRILSMTHIANAIEALGVKNVIFDGELYNHAYHAKFQELSHFIRQSEFIPGCEIVQYHIYDIADETSTFKDRTDTIHTYDLEGITVMKNIHPLVTVETIIVADEDELMVAFEHFLDEGYEGAMVRNSLSKYEIPISASERSYNLQKVKKFDDAEFECVGVEEGRGKLAGHAIFVCTTPKHVTFKAKMKGKQDDLKKYWDKPALVIGKKITVKYQGFTDDGKPRFGVAWRIREDV